MELMWTCSCLWRSTGQYTSLPLDQRHLSWFQIPLSLVTSSVRTHLLMTRSFHDFMVRCIIFAYVYHESLSQNYDLGTNHLQSCRVYQFRQTLILLHFVAMFDIVIKYNLLLTWLECLVTEQIQGVLADILEPIMGKGLIPADLETWKVRRRGLMPNETI